MKPHKDTHFPLPHVAEVTCMDPNLPPLVAEKVCKTVRFLIQNGVSKSKVMHDMQDVMKRGKNIGKALNNVMVRHHEALTCRSRDAHLSFVSPLEYQFSCSGSPPRLSHVSKRRWPLSPATGAGSRWQQNRRGTLMCGGADTDVLVEHYCPVGRRVKITGSAGSMLSHTEKEFRVDEAAEEFIERFYRDLRLQKWLDHHYC